MVETFRFNSYFKYTFYFVSDITGNTIECGGDSLVIYRAEISADKGYSRDELLQIFDEIIEQGEK